MVKRCEQITKATMGYQIWLYLVLNLENFLSLVWITTRLLHMNGDPFCYWSQRVCGAAALLEVQEFTWRVKWRNEITLHFGCVRLRLSFIVFLGS